MSPPPSDGDRLLGEIVAFAALPAVWVGQPPSEVARALADAIDRTLFPEAVAVILRAGGSTLDARAGDGARLADDVAAYQQGRPVAPETFRVDVGPLGRSGAILVRPADVPRERLILVRLAATLAHTALRETALVHDAAAAREQLAKMEKLSALGQLVSGVAHELRTPLTYGTNSLHLAQSRVARAQGLSPEARDEISGLLEEALSAHERIAHTVATLRHLASSRPVIADFSLSEEVAEATRLFSLTNVGRVVITRKLEAAGAVTGDRVEIHQVVLNLLQNAVEAAPEGARVLVATRDEAGGVRLIVDDNGPGIAAEAVGRLFDPFFTTKPEGMGLGLSIVRRIAEAHRATIEIGRSASGGARVELRFPLAGVAPEAGRRASGPLTST